MAQLEHWNVFNPVFSPDGQWLAFSILNTDLPNPLVSAAVMHLSTCQVIPLPISGTLHEWRP